MFWKKINKAFSLDEEPEIAVATNAPVFVNSVTNTPKGVINSSTIQKDISYTLDNLLDEMSKPFPIEENLTLLNATKENFEKENKELSQKIQTLKDLGFDNTPSVRLIEHKLKQVREMYEDKIKKLEESLQYNKDILRLTQEYALKYPSFKFIPKKTMVQILKKYGLIMGESSMYSKEIPDKALQIISQFSEDIKKKGFIYVIYNGNRYYTDTYKSADILYSYKDKNTVERAVIKGNPGRGYGVEEFGTFNALKMVAPLDHFVLPKNYQVNKDNIISFTFNDILAEIERRRLEDPIACLEVPMGYIILAAWDKEAEIPEIKNPLNN